MLRKHSMADAAFLPAFVGLGILLAGVMLIAVRLVETNFTIIPGSFLLVMLTMAAAAIMIIELSETTAELFEHVTWHVSAFLFGGQFKKDVAAAIMRGPPVRAMLGFSSFPLLVGVALAGLLGLENPYWLIVLFVGVILVSTPFFVKWSEVFREHNQLLEELLGKGESLATFINIIIGRASKIFQRILMARLGLTVVVLGFLMLRLFGYELSPTLISGLIFLGSAAFLTEFLFKVGTRMPILPLTATQKQNTHRRTGKIKTVKAKSESSPGKEEMKKKEQPTLKTLERAGKTEETGKVETEEELKSVSPQKPRDIRIKFSKAVMKPPRTGGVEKYTKGETAELTKLIAELGREVRKLRERSGI